MGYICGNFWKRNTIISTIISVVSALFGIFLIIGSRNPIYLGLLGVIIFIAGWYAGFIRTPIKKKK